MNKKQREINKVIERQREETPECLGVEYSPTAIHLQISTAKRRTHRIHINKSVLIQLMLLNSEFCIEWKCLTILNILKKYRTD